MADVAFIGLGAMGLAMANNVIKGGYAVVGYDTSAPAMKAHVANGGAVASSAALAASGCRVVVTMLPHGGVVRSALFDAGGVMESISPETLVVDMSTIHPLETDALRKDLKAGGIPMVDAPVGRTSLHAKTGELLIMAGAEPADLEKARPILECMGETIINCGGPGLGSRMKIVNNLMTTVLNVLTAEVLTFSDAVGLDRDLAIDVMRGTPAVQSHMTTTYQAKVLKGDLSPAFMIDLAMKDLGIALDLSRRLGVPQTLAAESEAVYSEAQAGGRGTQDWTAIYDMLRGKYSPIPATGEAV